MSNGKPNLFDSHSELFRTAFERGASYRDYLKTASPEQLERWQSFASAIEIAPSQRALLASFKRQMNVLVLSGIWCGDCMRQCPMIDAIEQACPPMTVRYVDNHAMPELRDELRVAGGARVPIAVVLSEDFFEVGRFGDRTLSAYRRKALTELGPACDSGVGLPGTQELRSEIEEWVEMFERCQLVLRLSPALRQRHND